MRSRTPRSSRSAPAPRGSLSGRAAWSRRWSACSPPIPKTSGRRNSTPASGRGCGRSWNPRRDLLDPAVADILDAALAQDMRGYYDAVFRRYALRDEMLAFFERYDALLSPTLPDLRPRGGPKHSGRTRAPQPCLVGLLHLSVQPDRPARRIAAGGPLRRRDARRAADRHAAQRRRRRAQDRGLARRARSRSAPTQGARPIELLGQDPGVSSQRAET